MNFNEYQKLAQRTSNTKSQMDKIMNGVLGLNGESGEVIDVIKKYMFQGHGLDTDKIIDELGDVLWYIAELAEGIGMNLSEIAEYNIVKLRKRYPEGFEADKSMNRIDENEGSN